MSLEQSILYVGDFAKSCKTKDITYRPTTLSTLANRTGPIRMLGSAAAAFAFIMSG
jgi:hypothetical protein